MKFVSKGERLYVDFVDRAERLLLHARANRLNGIHCVPVLFVEHEFEVRFRLVRPLFGGAASLFTDS